jgi:16S rRNA (guanine527-N7)-methyltransferase
MSHLQKGLEELGLESSGSRVDRLESYISEIELWNPKYGMIAPGEDIVGRHVLDSLGGLSLIQGLKPRSLADVGSGAGFPGIPLAIWLENVPVTLIERSGRRAGFLRNVVLLLGLKNVTILERPVEELTADGLGFDVITFRAWSAIDDGLLTSLASLLSPGGSLAAYKGRKVVIDTELANVSGRLTSRDIIPLKVPGQSDERHLVLLKIR